MNLTALPHERRVIRVFHVDLPETQAEALIAPAGPLSPTSRPTRAAAAQLLGQNGLDTDHIELFAARTFNEMGLATYLSDGHGVPDKDLSADMARLNRLTGYILIVLSDAFGGTGGTLSPAPGVSPIASYGEEPVDWSAGPMPDTASAKPYSKPRRSPRQARSEARRIGARIFAAFMVIIVLILWLILI